MKKQINLLLDGDWVLYTAGFAGESKRYVCPALYGGQEFQHLAVLKSEEGFHPEALVYHRVDLSPVEWVLHTAKSMITNAKEKVEAKVGQEVKLRVMMDGTGNFRQQVATIKPYKGNRVSARPVHYPKLRQYLLDNWDAEIIEGREVDDAMATLATLNPKGTVMCAVDKDMLQVPGYHYNPNKGFKRVSQEQGDLFLYTQCLTGDSTDNIGGCYKLGPKKAEALLDSKMPNHDKWEVVVKAYAESIVTYGDDTYGGLTAEEAAIENMQLVYLQRTDDDIWMPPTGGK